MELDARKRTILRLVIESYIEDAQPVSSSVIARELKTLATTRASDRTETWSSATIRNVMAELEVDGYLAQPHTSAGRVPTEKGLRFYLNDLMSPKLHPWDRTRLDEVAANVDAVYLPTALGQSLAGLSRLVALIALPGFMNGRFRSLVVEGTIHLIEQPEFADIGKLKTLVRAIEDEAAVQALLDKLVESPTAPQCDSVRVILASEHEASDLDVAFVGRSWVNPAGQQATVSILGPRRMDFGRLVALVDYASHLLGKYWERI